MSWELIENYLFEKYCIEEDKNLSNLMTEHDIEICNQTIDEFVRKLKRVRGFGLITNFDKPFGITFNKLDEIAEELRGDKNQKNK